MKFSLIILLAILSYAKADTICSCTETNPPLPIGEGEPYTIASSEWVLTEFTTWETYNLFFGVILPHLQLEATPVVELVQLQNDEIVFVGNLERSEASDYYLLEEAISLNNANLYAVLVKFPENEDIIEWKTYLSGFLLRPVPAGVSQISMSSDSGDTWTSESELDVHMSGAVIIKEQPTIKIEINETPLQISGTGTIEYSLDLIDWLEWESADHDTLLESKNLFFRSTQKVF